MIRLFIFVFFISTSTLLFGQRYLFYLHGKIIEDQGINAVDTVNGYGAYEYVNILNFFRKNNFVVNSEVRRKNTNPSDYSLKIVNQIDSLILRGVNPSNITIVGASKGAYIAMLVSSHLKNKDLKFVFMAGCNDGSLKQFLGIQFYGKILSIYEKSDPIGRSCVEFFKKTPLNISLYKEIVLHTGLKHGFIYKPLPEWIDPVVKWARNINQ